MSERVRLPDWESEPSAPVSLSTVTYGDEVQLRFAAAEWSQIHNRPMPSEGVSRVLGLRALSSSNFSVQFDTDNDFKRDGLLKTATIQDVINAERNRKDQAPEGNTLAAILVNGKPAHEAEKPVVHGYTFSDLLETTGKHTELDGLEVAKACREGDLLWEEVPKRMFVDIWYGQSVYRAPENSDFISRQELVTYGIQLRCWGDGVFKVLKPMYMADARTTDRYDLGRNAQLEAWAETLRPGMRVRCFSGEGESGLALARAPLTIIERDAASPADSELVRQQRELARSAMGQAEIVEDKKAPRVLNIDFAGVPANSHHGRQSLRSRVRRQITESAHHDRAVLGGLHGGYAVSG